MRHELILLALCSLSAWVPAGAEAPRAPAQAASADPASPTDQVPSDAAEVVPLAVGSQMPDAAAASDRSSRAPTP